MASKSGKQKATTFWPATQVLSANLSNSAFGFLPATGSKGKSPAVSSRSVNVQPDLDLIGGFAFLSFSSLDQLETHIEHNEAKFAAVSVDVGQKRKAKDPVKPQGNNSELDGPPNKKKAATSKKKPAKKISSLSTSDLEAAKPKESSPPWKNKTPLVDTGLLFHDELTSRSAQIGVSCRREQSPNSELEISLLCSETVPDLGDDEEIPRQEVLRLPVKAVANSDKRGVGVGSADIPSIHVNDDVGMVEGGITVDNSKPKKKKKKKRKSEHCDQTSQTKFRIKKKKKPASQKQDLVGSSNVKVDEFKNDEPLDDDDDKSQTKASLSRTKIEKVKCARTSIYQGHYKSNFFKNRTSGLGLSSGMNSSNSSELIQAKSVDRISLDGCIDPNSSDREIDVCDIETRSMSMLSDISDHSSDIELFDPHGCFLLNNKIDKVEKEEFLEGDEIADVDIETVEKEVKKNFLVVSGIEAGHFSYHPGITKEGTIDTSIQAYPNEIDIFLQCAKMQEGHIIKIINPDDSDELQSHFTQKGGRDPSAVKATRSATERKRRHHLGDLFHDMKMEVFTDLMESDLYFSKQAILSKAIGTLDELVKEQSDLSDAKKQLFKQNKELKEKRNMLLFGKASVDVDNARVEAILNQLNISVEDIERSDENTSQENEDANVKQEAVNESNAIVEPSAKGRPRANKSFLPPWLFKPALKPRNVSSKSTANVPQKTNPTDPVETPKVAQTETELSQPLLALKTSNVSCGVQTLGVESGSAKSSGLENPTLPQILLLGSSEVKGKPADESVCQEASAPSVAENSPKVIHTVTSTSQAAPETKISDASSGSQAKEMEKESPKSTGTGSSTTSKTLLTDNITLKSPPLDQSSNQEGPKPSLVKILPKPAILQLNQTQQKAFMESLGQIKQPSSDKIICNLSRLSTQVNSATPSRICIIRGSQLMKSLDSKNVMHLKITNSDTDNSSTSTTSTMSSQPVLSDINTAPNVLLMSNTQKAILPSSTAQMAQKHPEKTVLASAISSQPVSSNIKTVPGVLFVRSAVKSEVPTSPAQIPQKYPEKTMLAPAISSQPVSSNIKTVPGVLFVRSAVKSEVPTSPAQIPQKYPEKTMPTSPTSSQAILSDIKTAPGNVLLVRRAKKPEMLTSTAQPPQKQPEKTMPGFATSSQPISSDINSVPNVILVRRAQKPEMLTSTAQLPQKHPEKIILGSATSSQSVLSGLKPAPNVLLMNSTQFTPEVPTSTAQLPQKHSGKTMPASVTAGQSVSSDIKTAPVKLLLGSSKIYEAPTLTAQLPQTHLEKTMLVSQIPLTSAASSTPKVIFSGQQFNLLPSSHTETVPNASQTNVDVTLRALASLNQLQANKPVPPLTETVTNPLVPNRNPVAGYLIDLKKVVMKVGSGGPKNQPTSSYHTIPIVAMTTSFKAATTSQVSVTSSSHKSLEKCTVSTVCSTPFVFIPSSISLNSSFTSSHTSLEKCSASTICSAVSALPVTSIPSSTSLRSSFTMSALNQPVPISSAATGISADLDTSVASLIDTCLDPFNLVPKQLPMSNPPTSSGTSVVSSSLDVRTEAGRQVQESESTMSPLLIPDEIFKPETSSSSSVLTQEMLNILGIKQNPDLSTALLNSPELPLPDIFPNLDEMYKTIEAVEQTEHSDIISKEKPGGSDICSSGTQADAPSYCLRSSSTNSSKQTSPLKVTIRDFKKDKPLVKK